MADHTELSSLPPMVQQNLNAFLAGLRRSFGTRLVSVRAARVLIDAGLLHDAESRVYYAAYHAAVALLLIQDLEPRSHSGVANFIGLHTSSRQAGWMPATRGSLQGFRSTGSRRSTR